MSDLADRLVKAAADAVPPGLPTAEHVARAVTAAVLRELALVTNCRDDSLLCRDIADEIEGVGNE